MPPARMTSALVVLTFAAWVVQFVGLLGPRAVILGGFIPARLSGAELPVAAVPAWATPLTAALLHGGLMHVGFNLVMLAFTGRGVEPVLGPVRLLLLYIVSAYAAALGQWLAGPLDVAPMIGASGAVSGILAGYVLLYGQDRIVHANPTIARLLNLLWVAVAWILLQLLVGFTLSEGGVQVAVAAHIGGFAGGLAATPLLLRSRFRRRLPS